MKKFILLTIIMLCVNCVSESQQNGLDKVALLYNATTSYTKGFKTLNGKKNTYFTIKVSNSKMIDSLNSVTTCPNIALMLFDAFTNKEKKAYTYIHVDLKSKKDTTSFKYEPKMLETGLEQVKLFTQFSNNLLNQNYKGMVNQIDPKFIVDDLEILLKNYFDILITKHGAIKKYTRTGFGSVNLKNGKKLYRFSGYLNFNDGYNRFYFVNVPTQINNKKIQGYDFLNK